MCAGLSQCATRKRSGRVSASPRTDGEIVEDVDATTASAETRSDRRLNAARLRSTDSGSASWTNPHAPRSPSPHALLDPLERGGDLALRDHALLGHQRQIARDLAPRVRQDELAVGDGAILEIDQQDTMTAERERERNLAADASGTEHGDRVRHAGSFP